MNKKTKVKMTKDIVPEGFTIPLAMVDAVPVLFFGGAMVLAGVLLSSPLFLVGAALSLFAGVCKVIWKFIVVLQQRNIWWMFLQMRFLMPVGFLLMVLGCFIRSDGISGAVLWQMALSMPCVLFFLLGICCMALMMVFAFTLDASDAKANWLEQGTNGIAQASFFVGLLLMLLH